MKLSIGIPVYNGEATISETIISVVKQIVQSDRDNVEIVISDNCSTDNTGKVVNAIIAEYEDYNIKYFKNGENFGYDQNVDLVVKRCSSEYVWLLGDDDMLASGAIRKILEHISVYPETSYIFVNYQLVERETGRVLTEKVVSSQERKCYYKNANDFLRTVSIAPNFLSVNIFKKQDWEEFNFSKDYGSAWIQFTAMLTIIRGKPCGYIDFPYVINAGRGGGVAVDRGVGLGILLRLYEIVEEKVGNSNYDNDVARRMKDDIYKSLYKKITSSRRNGLRMNGKQMLSMIKKFKTRFGFWVFAIPLYILPRKVHLAVWTVYSKKRHMLYNYFR